VTEIERLARANGVWIDRPTPAPQTTQPPEAAGHAIEPLRRGPGRPRKSPDNPPVGGPAS